MRRFFVFLSLTTFTLALIPMFVSCTHEYKEDEIILDAVTDVDGNSYDAVKLGDQFWMRTNLRTTHFRDGSDIPQGGDYVYSDTLPFYYRPTMYELHNYDKINYGLYYNWASVGDSRGLCPDGWHVPSDVEWTKMEEYVRSKSGYVYGFNSQNIAKALASEVGWESNEVLGANCPFPIPNSPFPIPNFPFSILPSPSQRIFAAHLTTFVGQLLYGNWNYRPAAAQGWS